MSKGVQAAWTAAGLCLLLVLAGVTAAVSERIPDVGYLTRDTNAVAGVPWWAGVVSRLTNLAWAAAAALNLLSSRAALASLRRPLLLLGLLCAALALDDTMLVHEAVLPRLGVPEDLVLAVYAAAGLALFVGWFWSLRRTYVGAAFLAGAALLALSVAVDLVSSSLFLLEDGAKLAGVLAWCLCGVWAHSEASPTP